MKNNEVSFGNMKKIKAIDLFVLVYRIKSENQRVKLNDWALILEERLRKKAKIQSLSHMSYAEIQLENSRIRVFPNHKGATIIVISSKTDFAFKSCLNYIKAITNHKMLKFHKFNPENIDRAKTFGEFYMYLQLGDEELKQLAMKLVSCADKIQQCYVKIGNELYNLHYESKSKKYKMEARFNLNNINDVQNKFLYLEGHAMVLHY